MFGKRPSNEWARLLRERRSLASSPQLRELVRFLARRAAEEDYETLLMRQRRRKLGKGDEDQT
jgi:hypothetical protein